MRHSSSNALVLAIHPSTTGLGWVIFEGRDVLVDWGLTTARGDKNAACLKAIDALLDRFNPDVVILETFDGDATRRRARIRRLGKAIIKLVQKYRTRVSIMRREDIMRSFGDETPMTRFDIARAVSARLPEFRHLLPPKRKPWMNEDPRMALFAAVALAVSQLSSTALSVEP